MKRVGGVAAVVAAGAVVLTGCGSDLEADDPQGYKACEFFDKSLADDAEFEMKFGGALVAGEAASKAKTKAIRDSASPMFEDIDGIEDAPDVLSDTQAIDREALREACADEGYEFQN